MNIAVRPMTMISTDGRVFVAQLTRDLSAREREGADALASGAKTWPDAIQKFAVALSKNGSPVKAATQFRAAIERMMAVNKNGCCLVNAYMHRSRSGYMEVITYEVAKHPLTNSGNEGIVVRAYHLQLTRRGCIRVGYGDQIAFVSWHALGRMRERGGVSKLIASGFIAACGLAGMLMRESDKHANTEMNYADDSGMICTGVLREISQDNRLIGFFDVLTVLEVDDDRPALAAKRKQGRAIAIAVNKYFSGENSDPRGYADDIEVMPFHSADYVSRELLKGQDDDA